MRICNTKQTCHHNRVRPSIDNHRVTIRIDGMQHIELAQCRHAAVDHRQSTYKSGAIKMQFKLRTWIIGFLTNLRWLGCLEVHWSPHCYPSQQSSTTHWHTRSIEVPQDRQPSQWALMDCKGSPTMWTCPRIRSMMQSITAHIRRWMRNTLHYCHSSAPHVHLYGHIRWVVTPKIQ